jgi:hypothetical protein
MGMGGPTIKGGFSARLERVAGGGVMVIELAIPDDWTPGQALAVRALLQQALRGYPIIASVRRDATSDQVKDIYDRVGALIRQAGLAA